ncbi:mitochondrial import inner membrane translocase subunit Tim29 [Camponotus floridanus]|uniref:mitochondrial import inner membrane translocase subunit Tim29 n=1 Tax=Camponotus floridanus TaxID=104421 RepID=UPI000DC66A1E|nr:mitochondrial import inner membrane translocase subunit Tim29 [Camponotus floridanus]XP_019883052.2 mitochondrial import inner membrane translocase subunit Tim29 [Camponotus floridanus]
MNSQQIIQLPYRLKAVFKLFTSRFNEIGNKINNYEMPEKIKGTFLERWANYWHTLYKDYKGVAIDAVIDCKKRPVRAAIYTTFLGGCFYSSRCNPDETTFREQLIQSSIKLIQVGEPIRNPVSVQHIQWLEQCYNEGLVRTLNLGILSLIWLDNYDKDCSLYKAVCPYLKPRFVTFHERVVDIGFLNKWWLLERKMKDYDINEAEFSVTQITNNVNTTSAT